MLIQNTIDNYLGYLIKIFKICMALYDDGYLLGTWAIFFILQQTNEKTTTTASVDPATLGLGDLAVGNITFWDFPAHKEADFNRHI